LLGLALSFACGEGSLDVIGGSRSDPSPPSADPPQQTESVPPHPTIPLDPAFLALFDPDVLHRVDLTLPVEAWDGIHDDWQATAVALDGWPLEGAAARLTGPLAEFGWDGKSDLEIDLLVDGGSRYADCTRLALGAQQGDPAAAREVVTGRLLRDAGVAAPYSAFAELFVNGERIGLYTLRETVDSAFLGRRWLDTQGTLWAGDADSDFTAAGLEAFDPVSGADSTTLVAARLAVDGPAFWAAIGAAVNLDAFLAGWAMLDVEAADGGYPHIPGNAWWYADPEDQDRLVFIPGGGDGSWNAAFQADVAETALGAACLADADCDAARRTARDDALAVWPDLDPVGTLEAAYILTSGAVAADPNRGTTVGAVNSARVTLHSAFQAWPVTLGGL
jgi:hypothetical protein